MQKILLSDLKNGMITAEDVFSVDGQLIVPKGIALTENLIARLFSFDIFSIKIEDEILTTNLTDADFTEISYAEKLKASPDFLAFKEEFKENVDKLEFSLNALVEKNAEFDAQSLLSDTMGLIERRDSPTGIMDMILNMHDYDDCTYAHSLNVALICNIFAGWLRFSPAERELATACGLFHDVGKIQIPPEIIKKPDKLTPAEYKIVKTHPLESYKMLSRYNLPDDVKNAALMHHERCDGSGYPYGFTSEKINRFAKLVAIADVYEAMTSSRTYREALCPFNVITHFENDGLQKYDPAFLLPFLENVVNTFLNQQVRLTNGLEGRIIYINPVALSKPTIKVGNRFLDLKELDNVEIEKII
ncbi:MAG: HD-GYP domain-containing protein [Lachnospiraceae bacterium]|nr:HD-GYP domain-containing protein [Lachnospiraceae bacterium]